MKTVYKIYAVIAAVFVFGLCLVPFSRTAKAVDDNETQENTTYNFVTVTLPVQYVFRPLGSIVPYYVMGQVRFTVYNTVSWNSGGTMTSDILYTYGNTSGAITSNYLTSTTINPYYWFIPSSGTTSPGIAFSQGVQLTYSKDTSETISGKLHSFTTGLYEKDNTTCGFYVTFNFDVGYKTYNFYTNTALCTAYGQTVPLTTTINAVSADTINSYNEGYNAGKVEGYKNGYKDGEIAGKKAGYAEGKTDGYNEGRTAPQYSFKEFFIGLGDAFVTIYTSMLSYEFLGVNIAGLIGTVVVIITIMIVVKFILNK